MGYKFRLLWKSGRVAYCICLENRRACEGSVGSNPTSSDAKTTKFLVVFLFTTISRNGEILN